MNTKLLLLSFFIVIAFAACKKEKLTSLDIPKEDIYNDYYCYYNSSSQSTHFIATFFQYSSNSPEIILGSNSRIFADNLSVGFNDFNGYPQYTRYLGGLKDSLSIRWEYEEGANLFTYTNQLKIPAAISGNTCVVDAWHATAWGYNLYFQGDSVGRDEQVSLKLEVANPDTTFFIHLTESTEGRNYVHIPAATMQVLYDYGLSCTYFLSRTRKRNLTESTAAGGIITESYISDEESIYFQ